MVNKELVKFIRDGLNQGYSFDVLKPVLKHKGWHENDISKAFDKATSNHIFIGISISFVLFIILTSTFIFSLVSQSVEITGASIGLKNITTVSVMFTLYIVFALLIWLRMLTGYMNRMNRI